MARKNRQLLTHQSYLQMSSASAERRDGRHFRSRLPGQLPRGGRDDAERRPCENGRRTRIPSSGLYIHMYSSTYFHFKYPNATLIFSSSILRPRANESLVQTR